MPSNLLFTEKTSKDGIKMASWQFRDQCLSHFSPGRGIFS
jgi:hypothetical protein